MRGKIASAVGIGVLAAATPASAGSTVYATWAECMAFVAADDPFNQWVPACAANADGTWRVVWTQIKKKKK